TVSCPPMSVARRLLLRASRSAWLASQLRNRAFFRRAVRRFMPGEELPAALAAAADLAAAGIGSVLTQLGEQVATRQEAARVRDHYLDVLAHVRARRQTLGHSSGSTWKSRGTWTRHWRSSGPCAPSSRAWGCACRRIFAARPRTWTPCLRSSPRSDS